MDKDNQIEGLFERLKNIESKIEDENKKKSEPIKKQLESIKNENQPTNLKQINLNEISKP